ncbi:eIF-2-alpha kinase activator GCN1 [Schistosoma japonicum]|nr:eIF-2-alpha kinase activator GCN1 [Schistosoma japonicum]
MVVDTWIDELKGRETIVANKDEGNVRDYVYQELIQSINCLSNSSQKYSKCIEFIRSVCTNNLPTCLTVAKSLIHIPSEKCYIFRPLSKDVYSFRILSEVISFCRNDCEDLLNSDTVDVWCRSASYILFACDAKELKRNSYICSKLWSQNRFFFTLVLRHLISCTPVITNMAVVAHLCAFINQNSVPEFKAEYKDVFVNQLLKSLFDIKQDVTHICLRRCSSILNVCCDCTSFTVLVLPVVNRAILRSPETQLCIVNSLLDDLSFTLDPCAMELAHSVVKNLHAISEVTRRDAVTMLCTISKKCSEVDTLSSICKLVHAQFAGSEGKKSSQESRLAAITCFGELSNIGLVKQKSTSDRVATVAINLLIDYLERETYEEVIIFTAKQLARWLSRLKSSPPDRFFNFIKSYAFSNKTSASVHSVLLMCLDTALSNGVPGNKLPTAIIPNLLGSIEQASGQPHHSTAVHKSVMASLIWLRYILSTTKLPITEELFKSNIKSSPFWNMLTNVSATNNKRCALFTEKFLQTAPFYVLCAVGRLFKLLLSDLHAFIPNEVLGLIYTTLLLLCIHPFYDTVRQSNLDSIIELLAISDKEHQYQLTMGFLKHLHILLINYPNVLQSTSSSPNLLVLGSGLITEHLSLQLSDFVGINVWDNTAYPSFEIQTSKQPIGRIKCIGSFLCKLINILLLPSSSTIPKCNRISKENTNTSSPICIRYLIDLCTLSAFCTSHPCILSVRPMLWEQLQSKLHLPKLLNDNYGNSTGITSSDIDNWSKIIVEYFMNQPYTIPADRYALQRLIKWSPIGVGQHLIEKIHSSFCSEPFTSISEKDVQIMLTPEGQLFNHELLESLPKYEISCVNIKRESKLYSYDVQMDILSAQLRKAHEQNKHPLESNNDNISILDKLSDQLTAKQLAVVRNELNKENEIRKFMQSLDLKAKHMCDLLINSLSVLICQPSHHSSLPIYYQEAGQIIKHFCIKLSILFVKLLSNPLVSPYIIRAHNKFIEAIVFSTFTTQEKWHSNFSHELHNYAPMIYWWSIRILRPVRLMRSSDNLCSSQLSQYSTTSDQTDQFIHKHSIEDSIALTMCWSSQSIEDHTRKIFSILCDKVPVHNLNTSLLLSFLLPTINYVFLRSSWVQTLPEDSLSMNFSQRLENQHSMTNDWVTADLIKILLKAFENQFQMVTNNDDEHCQKDIAIQRDSVLHILRLDCFLRLLRQLVDGCQRDSTDSEDSNGLDENELSDDVPLNNSLNADDLALRKSVASIATGLMMLITDLFVHYVHTLENEEFIGELANPIVSTLLVGLVSESEQAREISARCLYKVVERIPSVIELITLQEKSSTIQSKCIKDSTDRTNACTTSSNDKNPTESSPNDEMICDDENVDGTDQPPEKSGDGKPRKRLNKNQRRKQKLTQSVAAAAEKHQVTEQMCTKPYTSPADWPKLSIWSLVQVRIWIIRSDASTHIAQLGEKMWNSLHLDMKCENMQLSNAKTNGVRALLERPNAPDLLNPMLLAQRLLLEATRPNVSVQTSIADAFAICLLDRNNDEISVVLNMLIHMYHVMLHRDPAVQDNRGRTLRPESPDRWRERNGLAMILTRLSDAPALLISQSSATPTSQIIFRQSLITSVSNEDKDNENTDLKSPDADNPSTGDAVSSNQSPMWLLNIFRFLVSDGLSDRNTVVQSEMLQAGLRTVCNFGKLYISQILPILENYVNKAPNVAELDSVRQSILILTGSLSQHLDASDPRVGTIFNRLLNTLNFPSDLVQQAVEDCLASLVGKLSEEQIAKTINKLMTTLLVSSNYAERHGAAHGIAGISRGLGIMSLKHHGIIDKLMPALDDTKVAKRREGALMAVERLSLGMGRLFEPYVVRFITPLLNTFGDTNPGVREAASNAARAVMSKLSAHGVKLILPALLKAIDDQQSWRTKAEAVDLLASMTHCASKQLSACLPQIVPRLLEVLVDSQDRVKQAGVRALTQIGKVVRNPEVQALVPLLTNCLQQPLADKTPCLAALRDTCFVHVLDAPSLALILPVIQRAFADRSTDTRKMAAQIFGNLHSLARKEELAPYVSTILPLLKTCLLDAVPEVRSAAAAALGAVVRGMGETSFSELLPWLMSTLTSETSSVDRSGGAQGLAEVLGGMGIEKLRVVLPDLIRTVSSESKLQPHIRDGYLMLFIYLPTVFQDDFAEFIGPIIPTILKSLSDETEFLRETALRAAQRIVHMFAETSLELLLPELEQGMTDSNWRIRHSSVQLLGELLYRLSGLSGKGTTKTTNEDDTFGTVEAHERLREIMGDERHDRILARLHLSRSDATITVRQSAIHIWKVVVPNTPRTLREIMPVLIRLLLNTLGSSSREHQHIAARALGDVVRKLGERILPEIIPLLVTGLDSPDADQRRGVCTGLTEIIRSCQRDLLSNYADSLLDPIRRTLCDPLIEVRRNGAKTFDLLYTAIGIRSLDGILPDILCQLDDPETSQYALDGIKQLLTVKSKVVMPYLIPKLTSPVVNVKAFAYLASVAGDTLTKQLGRILPALLQTVALMSESDNNTNRSKESQEGTENEDLVHCAAVLVCIYEASGIRQILNELLSGISTTVPLDDTANTTTTQHKLNISSNAYRIACLRLLHAYLEASFQNPSDVAATIGKSNLGNESSSDGDEETEGSDNNGDDDFEDGEASDDDGSFSSDDDYSYDNDDDINTDDDSYDDDDDESEENPDAKEVISRVLSESYPVALRNICRLLASTDKTTLIEAWKCLEALFKRWNPETVTSQIGDLRQGIRGALSEMNKLVADNKNENQKYLPGFSDPNLPLVSLVKLYAECTLHGRPAIKEPSAQGLSECILHASATALQGCVIKVIGPLIRLLSERQTNMVRIAVLQSLTSLISKCPQFVRPFVTQLQSTFLKCLGDSHKHTRILGGEGLSSIVPITPKLDPLLVDLARVSSQTVVSRFQNYLEDVSHEHGDTAPKLGVCATAHTLAGVAAYPDTSLQALRLCLEHSRGRAGLLALNSVLHSLIPLMRLPESSNIEGQFEVKAYRNDFGDDDNDYNSDDDDEQETMLGSFSQTKQIPISSDHVRVIASSCIGFIVVASEATIDGFPQSDDEKRTKKLELVNSLERKLCLSSSAKRDEKWTFTQSQGIALLIPLKHIPTVLINSETIQSGFCELLGRFIKQLCIHENPAICQIGYRCVGCFISHLTANHDVTYEPKALLELLGKGFEHSVIDMRMLSTVVSNHIAWHVKLPMPSWISTFVNILLAGTKDKNSPVRLGSETALAVLCRISAPKSNKDKCPNSGYLQVSKINFCIFLQLCCILIQLV